VIVVTLAISLTISEIRLI